MSHACEFFGTHKHFVKKKKRFEIFSNRFFDLTRKSSRISALAAKLLRCPSAGKALCHCHGTRRGYNIVKGSFVDIPQGDHTVMIKTAWDDTAIDKDAKMILESITEDLVSHILGGKIGPRETFSILKMKLIAYTRTSRAPFPFFLRKTRLHKRQGIDISALVIASVPKTQTNENAVSTCHIGKIETIADITQIILI